MTTIKEWEQRFTNMDKTDQDSQIKFLTSLDERIKEEFGLNILISIAKLARDYPTLPKQNEV